jgi:hypothetical protein
VCVAHTTNTHYTHLLENPERNYRNNLCLCPLRVTSLAVAADWLRVSQAIRSSSGQLLTGGGAKTCCPSAVGRGYTMSPCAVSAAMCCEVACAVLFKSFIIVQFQFLFYFANLLFYFYCIPVFYYFFSFYFYSIFNISIFILFYSSLLIFFSFSFYLSIQISVSIFSIYIPPDPQYTSIQLACRVISNYLMTQAQKRGIFHDKQT